MMEKGEWKMTKNEIKELRDSIIKTYEGLTGRQYDCTNGWAQAADIKDKDTRNYAIFLIGRIATLNLLSWR